ncbi:MAG TPA: FKBP-type peptidyl-prolyl cis-trans isomerase [Bacteroidales bacterium]|jgi:peptidylprolyl isomerase|nr:FKBP-type peptidyl-prolyl cis-trans isomerase [Bacteroidales bacterium]
MSRRLILSIFIIISLISCHSYESPKTNEKAEENLYDTFMVYNRKMAEYENQLIEDYLARYHLSMNQTGTGLRYKILKEGEGPRIKEGQEVALEYKMYLLTGDLIKESKQNNLMRFTVGKADVISGLDEAIRLFQKGTIAKIIIPSHLAYGATGDQQHIPPRATLVLDIKIVELY